MNPKIHHYRSSVFDLETNPGIVELNSYTVHIPPTPDNRPAEIPIDHETTSNSSIFIDDNDRFENGIGFDPKHIGMKQTRPLTRVAKISVLVLIMYRIVRKEKILTWDVVFADVTACDWSTTGMSANHILPLHQIHDPSQYFSIYDSLIPSRVLVFLRTIALGLFMFWRVLHPNEDAYMLWGISVVCEIWFSSCWLIEQLPKLSPVFNREIDLEVLKEKFGNDLPSIDIFVSLADSAKEPPIVTANTVLSILAVGYPVEKITCYVSDERGSLLMFETMAETASFAKIWVPFCRKHDIEPRNPAAYFKLKRDRYKDKILKDFVRDRRRVKYEYDEFKVRVNGLIDSIRRRSDTYNTWEEVKILNQWRENNDDEKPLTIPKATWMANGTHWPATWEKPEPKHSRFGHEGIIQVLLNRLMHDDICLPMLVYVSREKKTGYDHNNKAGELNSLLRASAIMSNGVFILNLDCKTYIYNSEALREAMCFMMDLGGDQICYVQFPRGFKELDPSESSEKSLVFVDINMRALDGIQGPLCLGTGCIFRRKALYGFFPPRVLESDEDVETNILPLIPKKFGNSNLFVDSIGHGPHKRPICVLTVAEAVDVISSWYEDKTEWGEKIGFTYGSGEDLITGYKMHERGWRSVYCAADNKDAFRETSTNVNLSNRLHNFLRSASSSLRVFFSSNNALLGSRRLKFLQRVAYFDKEISPFTSVFVTVYCLLPAVSLFTNQLIVDSLNVTFLTYLLIISLTRSIISSLEIKWSRISIKEWWKNEQLWVVKGTSSDLAALLHVLLKTTIGVELLSDDNDGLHIVTLMLMMLSPIIIIMLNLIALAVASFRTIYSSNREWSRFIGGAVFSIWVLVHIFPSAQGFTRKHGKKPTIVYLWAGLISISISLLWLALEPSPAIA